MAILFPINSKAYWYISAYCGILLILPFLNKFILSATLVQRISFILLMSVLGFSPIWSFARGYSFGWLLVLYVFGATFRIYESLWKPLASWRFYLAVCLICGTAAFVSAAMGRMLLPEKLYVQLYPLLEERVSFFSVLSSAAVFLGILTLKISANKPFAEIIRILGGLCLGIYLFHVNPLVWPFFRKSVQELYGEHSALVAWGINVVILILIFIAGVLLDLCYVQLRKVLHISWIMKKSDRIGTWLYYKYLLVIRKLQKIFWKRD